MVLHPIAQPASPLPPGRQHLLPFVFLFPANAKLPPSMIFPQGTGSVEYSLNVVLKGKKKFGSAKKWTHSLILKVEISRKDVGAKLEVMGIADTTIPNSKQVVMVLPLWGVLMCSWNILLLFFLDMQIIILRCIFHKDCCRCNLSRRHFFNVLFIRQLVGISVEHV